MRDNDLEHILTSKHQSKADQNIALQPNAVHTALTFLLRYL